MCFEKPIPTHPVKQTEIGPLLSLLVEKGLDLPLSSESDEESVEFDRLMTSSSLSLLETAESLPSDDDVSIVISNHR